MKGKSARQYAEALYEAMRDTPEEKYPEIIHNFLLLLQKENKLKKAEYIIDEFVKYAKKSEGIREISVQSARKLEEGEIEKIKKAFGGKAEVSAAVDGSLIGGVRVEVDGLVYDASIKRQIAKLKEKLLT